MRLQVVEYTCTQWIYMSLQPSIPGLGLLVVIVIYRMVDCAGKCTAAINDSPPPAILHAAHQALYALDVYYLVATKVRIEVNI